MSSLPPSCASILVLFCVLASKVFKKGIFAYNEASIHIHPSHLSPLACATIPVASAPKSFARPSGIRELGIRRHATTHATERHPSTSPHTPSASFFSATAQLT
ncbi:hypothetical protein EDB81DRAFT_280096 [Dactylonectria macrodidyma]|uniref:Secreted protein n=1 Tax=Dactylonectria macrodidyma TaxID=307937 RepID=A0A9P9FLD4_9HYPO|nr:hypothetical protein EDB81DRAFT_280096 [Dactylonectria macrodidyma]